jgi:hypothetical protein
LLSRNSGGKFPSARVAVAIVGDTNLPAHGSAEMPVWGTIFRKMGSTGDTVSQMRIANIASYIEKLQVK